MMLTDVEQEFRRKSIKDKVIHCLCDQLALDFFKLDTEMNLVDLGADSLDNFEILMWFEEMFEVEIPDEVGQYFEYASIDTICKGLYKLKYDDYGNFEAFKMNQYSERVDISGMQIDFPNFKIPETVYVGTLGDITVYKSGSLIQVKVDNKTALTFGKENSLELIELLAKASK